MTIKSIKTQFPIFKHHPNLVYLDNAATSHKPQSVINKIKKFYEEDNSNIHRGIYQLSEKATEEYEAVRGKVAKFIGAESASEIVFTSGTTESINLVASSIGRELTSEDEIVVTEMEHHSNLLPWREISTSLQRESERALALQPAKAGKAAPKGALKSLRYIPINHEGQLELEQLDKIVTDNTKIVALTYISNVLGTINPVREIVKKIKEINPKCLVLIDAAQAVPHLPVDVQDLGCDFLVFSGHKMMGPTGVGVLWGRQDLLETMEPYQTGGGMISAVDIESGVKWAEVPEKFEAGTPNIAGVIGLGAAIDFLNNVGMSNICKHEAELTAYALEKLQVIKGIEVYGSKKLEPCGCDCGRCHTCKLERGEDQIICKNRLGIISFNLKGIHAHDVAQVVDEERIAVRAGHHCAMPLHHKLKVQGSVRASFYLYNDKSDVDRLVKGIGRVKKVFG